MIKCTICKKELSEEAFLKRPAFVGDVSYFKICSFCRERCRVNNNNRKDKRSAKAKEHYQENKKEILDKNRQYRINNLDKYNAYEKSDRRKAFRTKWLKQKRKDDPCRFLFYAAKRRAKLSNIEFNISKEDLIKIYPIDNRCPLLDIELIVNDNKMKDNSPSLDRIIPNEGYIKGNIMIISYKANRIKNDASLEELKKLTLCLDNILNERSI